MRFCATLLIGALLFAASVPANAQEFCNWRPRVIEDRFDIRSTTLILTTSRDTFGIYNNCVTIIRKQYGSILNFGVVNRFAPEIGVKSGYVLIKSIRTLSNEPPIKLTLSRGGGWYLSGGAGAPLSVAGEMPYVPFKGTIETWNEAHSNPGNPSEFSQRLNIPWHAYALTDMTLSSSDLAEFWKVDSSFDRAHGVVTNYLLRFDVNTGPKVSAIPFSIFLQQEVQQIQLRIISNIESLSGEYRFVVR